MFELSFLEIVLLVLSSIYDVKIVVGRIFVLFFASVFAGEGELPVLPRNSIGRMMIDDIIIYIVAVVVLLC